MSVIQPIDFISYTVFMRVIGGKKNQKFIFGQRLASTFFSAIRHVPNAHVAKRATAASKHALRLDTR